VIPSSNTVILILYTTRYREGGREMEAAARQMADNKRAQFPGSEVCLRCIESKAEFLDAIAAAMEGGRSLRELHFIGHSGLYGPMFGTRAHPEQMSRYEWGRLAIAFTPNAEAMFHCCRSGRWFGPYFSRRYGVITHGYTSYTTFSRRPDRYVPLRNPIEEGPIYVVSCPGYKAMGLRGLVRKRLMGGATLPLMRFEPVETPETGSYDEVAGLYDAVFEDFRVRHDEWRWLTRQLQEVEAPHLLDIGCGNGALLCALAPLLGHGVGVDVSARMVEIATRKSTGEAGLAYCRIEGPHLPFPDGSFDVVVSMLSWRYLDWDPIAAEIRRVLRPGGRLLIVDMVVAPFQIKAVPRVLADRVRTVVRELERPRFRRALKHLVEDPHWDAMLQHNPMRAEHEMRWYLPSRFPDGRFTTLNRGPRTEILAFRWDKR
jgi:SAM-dependent methyltransferase